jgi:hypothetical protein
MALDTQKEKFIKEFDFELDNRVTSYETLEKLDKIKKSIKNSQEQMGKSELTTMNLSEKTINNGDVESPSNSSHTLDTRKGCGKKGKWDGRGYWICGLTQIDSGTYLCPECLKNNSQVNENNNSCKSSVYADNLDIPEEKTTADLFLDAEKTYLKYSEEQGLCKKAYIGIKDCGCVVCAMVKEDFDYEEDTLVEWKEKNLKIKVVDLEEARRRLKVCKCKKFEPMEKKK